MSQAQTYYEANPFYGSLIWSSVTERIGQDLREWYPVPKELPAKMVALVRKLDAIENKFPGARTLIGTLDAIEGNQLLRHSETLPDREKMIEARIVAGVKAYPDWFVLT
jgi:hypothetical protein